MDQLTTRYLELSRVQNFDAETYAADWHKLAADARAQNRPFLAESCEGRAKQYEPYQGECVRLIEGNLSEVVEAD